MPDYHKLRDDSIAQLKAGDAQASFQTFRSCLYELSGAPTQFVEIFEHFADISEHFADESFVKRVRDACARPEDPQALFDLGSMLYGEGLPDVALPVLKRAHQIVPNEPVVLSELVLCYEGTMQCHEAVRVLREAGPLVGDNFILTYFLAFHLVMTREIEEARAVNERVQALACEPDQTYMAARIQRMLDRAGRIRAVSSLDARDLRGWHYVVTGGLLTYLSPFGYPEPMSGRFAYTQDSYATIKHGIEALQSVVAQLAWQPEEVHALEDRSSQILAEAVGTVFGLPVKPWSARSQGVAAVVAAYDPSQVDLAPYEALQIREAQTLFYAHAMCWTQQCSYSPDVLTYLHQFNAAPWDGKLGGEVAGEMQEIPEDGRPVSELVHEILAASPVDYSAEELVPPALTRSFVAAAMPFPPAGEPRETLWECSPVPSNRFN